MPEDQDKNSGRDLEREKPPREPGARRRIVLRGELDGPGGCLVGGLFFLIALAILGAMALLGLIAFTVLVWIAAGLVLAALIGALLGLGRRG